MELKSNQSAIILEADENGEITAEVASSDHEGMTAKLCIAIAKKIMTDTDFQAELMDKVEEQER